MSIRQIKRGTAGGEGCWFKSSLFVLLAGIAFWVFQLFEARQSPASAPSPQESYRPSAVSHVPEELLPAGTTGTVIRRTYYVLSYSHEHKQAEWAAYELLRERLVQPWVERSSHFRPDPDVPGGGATPRDYSGSGYDRGHLVPAADMAFDRLAMDETFLMTNISPQERLFNGGIWRELEENTRDWAKTLEQLYIVTGPVLTRPAKERIGANKVAVPAAFYKVILAPRQRRAIAFVIPNERQERHLMEYACPIDEVEAVTGIDFFPIVLGGENAHIEASVEESLWPVNARRYERRLRQWNTRSHR